MKEWPIEPQEPNSDGTDSPEWAKFVKENRRTTRQMSLLRRLSNIDKKEQKQRVINYRCGDCGLVTEEQAHWTFHLAGRPESCALVRMSKEIAGWSPSFRDIDRNLYDWGLWEVEVSG